MTLGQLYLNGGRHNGQQVLPETWVKASLQPRAVVDGHAGVEYGYLWWLMQLPGSTGPVASQAMNGTGGNTVQILPDHDTVIVVTTTNFDIRQPHLVTMRLIAEHILPMVAPSRD